MAFAYRMGLVLALLAGVTGCQGNRPQLDALADIEKANLVSSGIEFRTQPEPLDADGDESSLTLNQAAVLALKNSPELQTFLWKMRLAQADSDQERLLPNPILSLTVRFPEGGAGKSAIDAGIAADLLSLLKRPGRISAADHALRASAANVLAAALGTLSDANEKYIAAAIIDDELVVLEERKKLVDRLLNLATMRLKAGEGTRLDETTLQAQRVELEADMASKELEKSQARIALARVIGRPAGRIDWKLEPLTMPGLVSSDEMQWVAMGMAARPEIEAHRWELAALGEEVKLAGWPFVDGTEVGVAAQRDPDWQVGPAVVTPLPIFDTGKTKKDKAQAARTVAMHEMVSTQRQVVEEIRLAYAAARASSLAVTKIEKELIPLVEKRRDQAEAAYKAGEADLTTLIVAQDALQSTRMKLLELREKWALEQIKLERAAGGRGAASKIVSTSRPTTAPAPQVTQ